MNKYKQSVESIITEWIFKVAIIIFVFKIFYHTKEESFFESQFIEGALGIFKFLLFIVISLAVSVFKKNTFKVVGYLVVFIGSFYYALMIVADNPITFKLAEYLLIMAAALYGLVRATRVSRRD